MQFGFLKQQSTRTLRDCKGSGSWPDFSVTSCLHVYFPSRVIEKETHRLCGLALGKLDSKLDVVLQACDRGESDYYLIDQKQVEDLKWHAIEVMERFIDEMYQPQLVPLVARMATRRARVFKRQDESLDDLKAIARYVAGRSPLLFLKLRHLAGKSRGIDGPSDSFLHTMGLSAPKR